MVAIHAQGYSLVLNFGVHCKPDYHAADQGAWHMAC
jgi:hypothetical protein